MIVMEGSRTNSSSQTNQKIDNEKQRISNFTMKATANTEEQLITIIPTPSSAPINTDTPRKNDNELNNKNQHRKQKPDT